MQFLATSFFVRTMHRSIGPVRRSHYCSERFRLSLLPIFGLPTAQTSTLLITRCGVRCRTVFIGRRCKALTIWNSIWLTCGTVWSKASSTTQSTSGVHNFVSVSVRKGDISNSLCNLHLNFVINILFVTTEVEYIVLIWKCLFVTIVISQGNVATDLKCGGWCNNHSVANLLPNSTVKKNWKSVNICQSYGQKHRGPFFDLQCVYPNTPESGQVNFFYGVPVTITSARITYCETQWVLKFYTYPELISCYTRGVCMHAFLV